MKAHAFDPLSFVAGVVFTGLGLAGAGGLLADVENLRLVWPLAAILLGGLLVASTLRPHRDRVPAEVATEGGIDDLAPSGDGSDPLDAASAPDRDD